MVNRRVAVRGIVIQDNKILAVRHKEADGTSSPYWSLPGGGLDPLESLTDGLTREFIEETGVIVEADALVLIQQFGDTSREFLEFFFTIQQPELFPQLIHLAQTSHGDSEIAEIAFIDPHKEYILPAIFSTEPLSTWSQAAGAPRIYTDFSAT